MNMHNEIVGFQINNIIYSGFHAIDVAKQNANHIEKIITRALAYFMSCCDLGTKWEQLANSKTILIKNGDTYALPDGYYTNANKEIFEIKEGVKTIIPHGVIIDD